MKSSIVLLSLLVLNLFNNISFTRINKTTLTLNSADDKYIFITTGFKSCHDCYAILYNELEKISNNQHFNIQFLSEYKDDIMSRKMIQNAMTKNVHAQQLVNIYFDKDDNAFFTEHKLDIHPNLVIINKGKLSILHYKSMFDDDGLKAKSLESFLDNH